MSCFRITKTNENGSLLFAKLNMIVKDEDIADSLYSYFDISQENSEFKEIFGDYVTEYKSGDTSDRVDINGEPLLFFNSVLNKHFFLDKDNEPVFYPYTRQGLGKVMSVADIKKFAKVMALKFFDNNLEFNFSDLEFTQKETTNLTKFVESVLKSKASQLLSSKDMMQKARGIQLSQTTEDVSEWVNEVKDFYRTLKLEYIDNNDSEEISEQEEEQRGEVARKEAFLKSAKTNVSNTIKLFISLTTTSKLNDYNEFEFVDFDDIYPTLNKTLSNIVPTINEEGKLEDPFDLYVDEIEKLIKFKPYIKELYTRLKDIRDEQFKNQFVVAFNLHKNNFLGSEFFRGEKGNIEYSVRNLSEIGTRKNSILSQWKHNFDQLKLTTSELTSLSNEFKNLAKTFQANSKKVTTEKQFNEYKVATERLLRQLGVEFTLEGFEFFLSGLSLDKSKLSTRKDKLLSVSTSASYALDLAIASKEDFNIFTNQNIFRQMSEAEAFFMKEGTDASFFTLGKTKWNYSMPSYIDLKVAQWKKNPELLKTLYYSTPYNQGSYYMRYLLALDINKDKRDKVSKERINNIEVGIFNSVQQRGDSQNAADNTNLSYTDSMVDYIHKLLGYRKANGKTYHKTALAADKSTEYQINYGVDELRSDAKMIGGKVQVSEGVIDVFYNYFKSEYERMIIVFDEILNNDNLKVNYHTGAKNGLKSQLFPSMSIKIEEDGSITLPDLGFDLYDKDGKPLYTNLDEIKDKITTIIEDKLSEGINKTFQGLIDNKIVVFDKSAKLKNNSIDSEIYNSYKGTNNQIALQIAGDIFINSVVSQVEYSKMFTGDVAYYKDTMDYKKRVPETYTDGLYMRLLQGEENFNISVIDGVYMPAPSLEKLKEFLSEKAYKHYERVNATDAQAWITPERWKFIMERIGKFDNKRKVVYQKMLQSNPKFTKDELKLMAQPLKGVYYDMTDESVPVFLKYSQAVLLPSLIKGTQLEVLYNKMTKDDNGKTLPYKDQIHELITEDGIKVGAGIPSPTNDVDGNVLPISDIKLNKMILNNASWKLQQDLPVKGMKATDVGSQIQTNIFQGLIHNTNTVFEINGKELSNVETIEYLNSIVGELSRMGLERVINQFGVNKETYKIENEAALYNSLIKQLKTRNDVPSNFIKALEAGISPYGIPGSFNMFQNVFSSAINKEVIKIKTNGGGFIQMSDYGISYDETKKQGIKFTPWFTKNKKTAKLHTPEIRKNKDGKDILIPGAVFLSGSFIAKYIPDYRTISDEKLFGTYNEETGLYENGMIDEKILTNLIGYRIPNQGLPSNDALMIAGILPEEMGDTIIPYTGMTAKTGSDYDIDKMYLMMASFKADYGPSGYKQAEKYIKDNNITIDEIKEELNNEGYDTSDLISSQSFKDLFISEILLNESGKIDSELNKDFSTILESVNRLIYSEPILDKNGVELPLINQPLNVVQNKLIEAYKSILLNKDVINDVMNSIDLQHIKNDIKNLIPDKQSEDIMDFDAFTDLELKNHFALGKAGLGQNVNASQDAVRGAMGVQFLNEVYLGWGNSNADGNTIFDQQYSVELSEKDIKGYVKSFNKNLPSDKHITEAEVRNYSKLSLDETMMVMMNAFVDIAKDSYIVKGNWVTQTNNTGFMMLRAGIHPFYVNAFLAQPILQEYVKFKNNMESQTIQESSDIINKFKLQKAQSKIDKEDSIIINDKTMKLKHLFRSTVTADKIRWIGKVTGEKYESNIEIFKTKIKDDLKVIFKIDKKSKGEELDVIIDLFVNTYKEIFEIDTVEFDSLSLEDLRNQIKGEEDMSMQMTIFNKFNEYKEPTKTLSNGTKASRITVDGKGKNITSLIIANNRINNMLLQQNEPGGLNGFNTKLQYNGQDTILNHYKKNSIDVPYKIMRMNPKYFLTASNSVVSTFNEISQSIYGTTLESTVLGDKLEKAYYSYVMSGFQPLQTTKEEKIDLLNNMPSKLFELKKTSNNSLIQQLIIKDGDKNFKSYISMPNLRKVVSFKNTLTESWNELLENEPKFAEDLIKYAYAITGFNNSINQFHEFIPYEWFNKNRFNSYLKRLTLNDTLIDENFINQFFRHSSSDYSITKKVFSEQVDKTTTDYMKTTYTLLAPGKAPFMTRYIPVDEMGESLPTRYFRLLGYDNDKGVYIRTSLLGHRDSNTNTVVEYDITTNINKAPKSTTVESNIVYGRQMNVALFNKTLARTDLIKEYDATSVVTEGSIKETEKLLKPKQNNITNNQLDLFDQEDPFKCKNQ